MNIGIIPVISEERNIFFKVDIKLIKFLKFCFGKKIKIVILNERKKYKLDLIISSGGNDLTIFNNNKQNKLRNILDHFYIRSAIKNKIPYLGICFGAQKIANYFKSKIKKTNLHTKCSHKIKILNVNKIILRKSYHNFKITKLSKSLINLGVALNDSSCEFFKHKHKSIYGLMWHPEREYKFSNIEKKIFLKVL